LHIPATGTAHVGGLLPEIRLRQRNGHCTVGPVSVPPYTGGDSATW
jgi:hypothetical protein